MSVSLKSFASLNKSAVQILWSKGLRTNEDLLAMAATEVARKTLDINQFLVSKMGIGRTASDRADAAVAVTYHDPCHLSKSLGVTAEPRALIKTNPIYELKEMPESNWCCGLGGSFSLRHYELSANIGKRKEQNIAAAGSSVVATGCPACMIQIADMLSQSKRPMKIKHPVEIYADALVL